MSKIVLALLIVSAGLALWNLQLARKARESKATVVALQAEIESLQEQQRNAEAIASRPNTSFVPPPAVAARIEPQKKNTASRDQIGVLTNAASVVSNRPAMPSPEESMRMMREARERQRQLMQDPEYRDAMRLQAKSGLVRVYPGVVEEVGLDRQQADDFFALLADQQTRMSEAMEQMWDVDGRNDPAGLQERHRKIQQRTKELERKNDVEIAQRFGQDKLQAWKDYQSTLGARRELDDMRNALSAQGLPLGEQSNKAVLRALAEAQKAEMEEWAKNRGADQAISFQVSNELFAASPGTQNVERALEMTRKRNQRTLDAISPYLSFEQRSAIEKEQQAQLKLQEAQLRIMKAQGSNIGPSATVEFRNDSR